jgi:hypothetical protein
MSRHGTCIQFIIFEGCDTQNNEHFRIDSVFIVPVLSSFIALGKNGKTKMRRWDYNKFAKAKLDDHTLEKTGAILSYYGYHLSLREEGQGEAEELEKRDIYVVGTLERDNEAGGESSGESEDVELPKMEKKQQGSFPFERVSSFTVKFLRGTYVL